MKAWVTVALTAALLLATDSGNTACAQSGEHGPPKVIHRPNPRQAGSAPPAGSTSPTSPILDHGGPVITLPAVYLVWYGNWNQPNGSDTPDGQQIVRDFVAGVGSSPYFAINASYPGVSGGASFGAETTDAYSRGKRLKDSDVQRVISSAISSGRLPYDPSGVYFVLSSSDVSELSGFCKTYCGWHTAAKTSVGRIRYSFVGNVARCLNACSVQTVGPNGNAGADAMLSIIAHELEEAATDPDLNAWYDAKGRENADKCAWTFGHAMYKAANGAWANMGFGGRDYLIQRNLYHDIAGPSGIGDYCMMDSSQG